MAIFIPGLEDIKKFRVAPTAGEWFLLNFLKHLDDSYEIYFNPYLNEDRPDVLIMRKDHGILIIEVKDWNLSDYKVVQKQSSPFGPYNQDKKYSWLLIKNGAEIKSPIDQVSKYRENLLNFHIKGLLPELMLEPKKYAIVNTMVFFYGSNRNMLFNSINLNQFTQFYDFNGTNTKKSKYVANNCIFSEEDLTVKNFKQLLIKNYMGRDSKSKYFTEKMYLRFRQLLAPTEHMKNQGKSIDYTPKQMEIIYDVKYRNNKTGVMYTPKEKPTLNAYIRGTYGSGKTTVLAAKAVNTCLKLKKKIHDPKILVICYNIALVNWLRDRINAVQESFSYNDFTITNYHHFIQGFFNNAGIKIDLPDDSLVQIEKDEYWEKNYFGNYDLFKTYFLQESQHKEHEPDYFKFDAIFIDEVQDYHKIWTQILKEFFLRENGTYFVFGDEKQNIYDNPLENKIVKPYFGTKNVSYFRLNESKRSNNEIQDFLYEYQKKFLSNKYDLDSSLEKQTELHFFDKNLSKSIDYIEISKPNKLEKIISLIQLIEDLSQNKFNNINPNDITILGVEIKLLRLIDAIYRHTTGCKSETVFETIEFMILIWKKQHNPNSNFDELSKKVKKIIYKWMERQNFCNKENINAVKECIDQWIEQQAKKRSNNCSVFLENIEELLHKLSLINYGNFQELKSSILIWSEDQLSGKQLVSTLNKISEGVPDNKEIIQCELLTAYYLQKLFKDNIEPVLAFKCQKYRLNYDNVYKELDSNINSIKNMLKDIIDQNNNNYEDIRKQKKLYFEMNNGSLKLSTIHSFKGWESRVVFLLLDKKYENQNAFAELVYTGLSRTKENLVIINLGNFDYGSEFKEILSD